MKDVPDLPDIEFKAERRWRLSTLLHLVGALGVLGWCFCRLAFEAQLDQLLEFLGASLGQVPLVGSLVLFIVLVYGLQLRGNWHMRRRMTCRYSRGAFWWGDYRYALREIGSWTVTQHGILLVPEKPRTWFARFMYPMVVPAETDEQIARALSILEGRELQPAAA